MKTLFQIIERDGRAAVIAALGVDRRLISSWTTGYRGFSKTVLIRAATVYGTGFDLLGTERESGRRQAAFTKRKEREALEGLADESVRMVPRRAESGK